MNTHTHTQRHMRQHTHLSTHTYIHTPNHPSIPTHININAPKKLKRKKNVNALPDTELEGTY